MSLPPAAAATGQWLLLRFSTALLRNPKGQSPYGLGSGHRRQHSSAGSESPCYPVHPVHPAAGTRQGRRTKLELVVCRPTRAELFTPMQLPQDGWPVPKITAQSSSSSISAASDNGSDRTSSSSRTSSPQRKRNSESRDDADEGPPCEHTAASSLLMLFEEEGKPAVAPMPFFQFPRIAPAALSSAPLVKRPCLSYGTKARAQPAARGDASPCSPRACHPRWHPPMAPSAVTRESVQEAMHKIVQARLSSRSASGEQPREPSAWARAPCAAAPTPLAT